MPVIQQVDPLTAASEAVGAYADRKRQNETDAAAKAYQQSRDARKDMESDREFGIQQGEAADQHLVTQSQIKSAEQARAIAAADEAFTRSMDGINRQIAQAQLNGQNMANAAAKYDVQIKAAQAAYAKDLAKAGLATAQAQAHIAQVTSQNASANAAADLAQKAASTAQTKAATGLTGVETQEAQRRLTTGADDYHAPTTRGKADQNQQFDDAFNSLSPTGQQFYQSLYSTNNPPTRAQAMMALAASKRGGGLKPSDYPALQTLITSRDSQFVSPSEQAGQQRYEERNDRSDAAAGTRKNTADAASVMRSAAVRKLSPNLQEQLRQGIEAYGYDGAVSHLKQFAQSPGGAIDQPSAQAILTALGA